MFQLLGLGPIYYCDPAARNKNGLRNARLFDLADPNNADTSAWESTSSMASETVA